MTYNVSDVHIIRQDIFKILEGILSLRNNIPSLGREIQDQITTVEYDQLIDDTDDNNDDNDNDNDSDSNIDDITKFKAPLNSHDCDKPNTNKKSVLGQEDSKVLYKRPRYNCTKVSSF